MRDTRIENHVITQGKPHVQALRSLGWSHAVLVANVFKCRTVLRVTMDVDFAYDEVNIVAGNAQPGKQTRCEGLARRTPVSRDYSLKTWKIFIVAEFEDLLQHIVGHLAVGVHVG